MRLNDGIRSNPLSGRSHPTLHHEGGMPDIDLAHSVQKAVALLRDGFSTLPGWKSPESRTVLDDVLQKTALRLHDNYPYFHPLYAGQMLKPPHPVAMAAYMLAMSINPNNHALDGGRASSGMELEVVSDLARMFGWKEHLGHLCSGGTMANLEALWIAGLINDGRTIIASELAHYTHERISHVLRLPFQKVRCTADGIMDVTALESDLRKGNVGTVVVSMGTTGTGSLDPLPEILALRDRYGFRIHADAAYGGYFTLIDHLRPESRAKFEALTEVDSIVIDPHKHGLQPYGCGCVLFRDPSIGRFYKHDSPYTYFTSSDLHLGEISLECSRPGAAAVALWATHQALPPVRGGEFAANLARSRHAALDLYRRLAGDTRFIPLMEPELDIVVWGMNGATSDESSRRSRLLFQECAKRNLHLAVMDYPTALLSESWKRIKRNGDTMCCLRSCLMKPEHLDWIDEIWSIISSTADEILVKE